MRDISASRGMYSGTRSSVDDVNRLSNQGTGGIFRDIRAGKKAWRAKLWAWCVTQTYILFRYALASYLALYRASRFMKEEDTTDIKRWRRLL